MGRLSWKNIHDSFVKAASQEWGKSKEFMELTKSADKIAWQTEKELDKLQEIIQTTLRKGTAEQGAKLLQTFKVTKRGYAKAQRLLLDVDVDKQTKPKTYRALKVLVTGIDSVDASAEMEIKTLSGLIKAMGTEQNKETRTTEAHRKAMTQVKKSVIKSVALTQQVKSKPTPDVWAVAINRGMGRDPLMGLRSLRDAQKKGAFPEAPAPDAYMRQLKPYDISGAKERLRDADADTVIRELKTFTRILKQVKDTYQGIW